MDGEPCRIDTYEGIAVLIGKPRRMCFQAVDDAFMREVQSWICQAQARIYRSEAHERHGHQIQLRQLDLSYPERREGVHLPVLPGRDRNGRPATQSAAHPCQVHGHGLQRRVLVQRLRRGDASFHRHLVVRDEKVSGLRLHHGDAAGQANSKGAVLSESRTPIQTVQGYHVARPPQHKRMFTMQGPVRIRATDPGRGRVSRSGSAENSTGPNGMGNAPHRARRI